MSDSSWIVIGDELSATPVVLAVGQKRLNDRSQRCWPLRSASWSAATPVGAGASRSLLEAGPLLAERLGRRVRHRRRVVRGRAVIALGVVGNLDAVKYLRLEDVLIAQVADHDADAGIADRPPSAPVRVSVPWARPAMTVSSTSQRRAHSIGLIFIGGPWVRGRKVSVPQARRRRRIVTGVAGAWVRVQSASPT